jgi:glycosyltransferase involved in cell wall biosynthesis
MSRTSGFYAANTFHYRHVAQGMLEVLDEVTLARRFEVTSGLVERARRFGAPPALVSLLGRRAAEPLPGVRAVSLGPGQLIPPLMGRVDRLDRLANLRLSIDLQSKSVARRVKSPDVFWAMESLGRRTLATKTFPLVVCERRALHHEIFEGDPGVVGDFPFAFRPDPVGDFLVEVYEKSDLICVYSQVARKSYVDRGFDPDKVVVLPLGFPSLDVDDAATVRDPHVIAFVGRCDAFKGIDLAVAAVERLQPHFRLEVAGHASEEVREWLIRKPWVDYRGILDRTALTELYRRASVLISPSIESFGYAALEGAGHGAWLVCSTQTGAHEFLPSHSHTVVSGRDPDVWAHHVHQASARVSPVEEIRHALDALNWDASAAVVSRILRQAIDSGRGR